jgi:hypothetical protein
MEFVDALKSEIEKVRRDIVAAQARHAFLRQTLRDYQQSKGSGASPAPQVAIAPQKKQAAPPKQKAQPKQQAQPKQKAPTLNKTSAIRAVLVGRSASGIMPHAIVSELKRRSVKISANAVFAALSKLKQRKHVTVRDEKYYPTDSLLKQESKTSKS